MARNNETAHFLIHVFSENLTTYYTLKHVNQSVHMRRSECLFVLKRSRYMLTCVQFQYLKYRPFRLEVTCRQCLRLLKGVY